MQHSLNTVERYTYVGLGRAQCGSVQSPPQLCVQRVSGVTNASCQSESSHTSSSNTLAPSTTISHVSTSFPKLLTLSLYLIFLQLLTSYKSVNRIFKRISWIESSAVLINGLERILTCIINEFKFRDSARFPTANYLNFPRFTALFGDKFQGRFQYNMTHIFLAFLAFIYLYNYK